MANLKTGIRLHGIEVVDKIWKTCCALHNLLLEVDGLDQEWVGGVQQNVWQGVLGHHHEQDVANHLHPDALVRLHSPQARRQYNESGMGAGNDRNTTTNTEHPQQTSGDNIAQEQQDEQQNLPPCDVHVPVELSGTSNNNGGEDGVSPRIVRNLSMHFFRSRLVEHFDILYSQNKVVWPRARQQQNCPRADNDIYNLH